MHPDENYIAIVDKKNATFKNCFKNPFVYEYCVDTPRVYTLARSKIVQSDLDEATKEIELEKSGNEIWSSHKQRQYDFISKHLNAGEFVEIYTEEVHGTNFNLGPPETECAMTLEELLDLPMPEKSIDKYKTTLYK
jgi:hypothetical protein